MLKTAHEYIAEAREEMLSEVNYSEKFTYPVKTDLPTKRTKIERGPWELEFIPREYDRPTKKYMIIVNWSRLDGKSGMEEFYVDPTGKERGLPKNMKEFYAEVLPELNYQAGTYIAKKR